MPRFGLPLLRVLYQPGFLAVLAHEYGHLRGDMSVLQSGSTTRLSLECLNHSLVNDEGPVVGARQLLIL